MVKLLLQKQKQKIRKEVEKLIAFAVKEKDNFEEVTVKAKVAKKDDKGRRVKEVVDGKKVTVYEEVEKTIKKDMPSRLHARRQMLKFFTQLQKLQEQHQEKYEEVDLVER